MQQARGDFLADSRRAHDEDPAAGCRDPLQGRANAVDRARTAGQVGFATDRGTQRRDLAAEAFGLGCASDHQQESFGLERLFDKIGRPTADCGNGRIKVAVPRNYQHRDRRIATLDLVEQFQPIETRALQPHIKQHQRRTPRCDRLQCGIAVASVAGLIAFVLQDAGYEFANVTFVVHDENIERH